MSENFEKKLEKFLKKTWNYQKHSKTMTEIEKVWKKLKHINWKSEKVVSLQILVNMSCLTLAIRKTYITGVIFFYQGSKVDEKHKERITKFYQANIHLIFEYMHHDLTGLIKNPNVHFTLGNKK